MKTRRLSDTWRAMLRAMLLFLLPLLAHASEPENIRRTLLAPFTPSQNAIPVTLFDVDQTLRVSTTQYRAPRHPSEVAILPEVAQKIRELNQRGIFVALISNQQSPVRDTGLKLIDETMAETVKQLEALGAKINYVDFAVTDAEAKPSPEMFHRLEKFLQEKFGREKSISRARSLMVGDAAYLAPVPGKSAGELRPNGKPGLDTSNFDRVFAERSGIPFQEPQDFFGWETNGVSRFTSHGDLLDYLARRKAWRKPECALLYGGLARL